MSNGNGIHTKEVPGAARWHLQGEWQPGYIWLEVSLTGFFKGPLSFWGKCSRATAAFLFADPDCLDYRCGPHEGWGTRAVRTIPLGDLPFL